MIALWADGQLAAVAPLCRKTLSFRKVSAKGLLFLSSDIGMTVNFMTADPALVPHLVGRFVHLQGWDVFLAWNLCTEKVTTGKFIEILDDELKGYGRQIVRGFHSPYLTTEGGWDEYWKRLPPQRQCYLKRMCLNRLRKADSYEVNQISTPEAFRKFLGDMFEISLKSWKSKVGDHLAPDSPQGRLYANFTPIALERSWVALHAMKISGATVGFEYLLKSGNTYLLQRCDYDEKYKYYSPGNSLRLGILKSLFAKPEICEYNMGGDCDSYKLEWCGKVHTHVTVTVGNRNLTGRAVLFAKTAALPFLRDLKRAITISR